MIPGEESIRIQNYKIDISSLIWSEKLKETSQRLAGRKETDARLTGMGAMKFSENRTERKMLRAYESYINGSCLGGRFYWWL